MGKTYKKRFKIGDFWRFVNESDTTESWSSRILSRILNSDGEARWVFIHYPGNEGIDFHPSWILITDDYGNIIENNEDQYGFRYRIVCKCKPPKWADWVQLVKVHGVDGR